LKTFVAKPKDINRQWYVLDAEGQTLGRLASRVASVLIGKHKPIFAPYLDSGDFVVIVNAAKVAVTGKKLQNKLYQRHSGYPGGLKTANLQRMLLKHPEKVIRFAVRGMLPHNRLGDQMYRKLKVYNGPTHPHQAQQPEPFPSETPLPEGR
jgi:large subunit ribosomal protein L13